MKRSFSILMMAVLLVSAFGFSAKPASAAGGAISYRDGHYVQGKGVAFIFDASGYRNKDIKGATIYVGSDFFDLGCVVVKKESKIVCVVRGDITGYAGQTGVIFLAGQVFYVIIPGRSSSDNGTFSCPEGTIMGADVTFETGGGDTVTFFVPGSTISEVQSNAKSYIDGSDIVGILDIGDLYCSEEQF